MSSDIIKEIGFSVILYQENQFVRKTEETVACVANLQERLRVVYEMNMASGEIKIQHGVAIKSNMSIYKEYDIV